MSVVRVAIEATDAGLWLLHVTEDGWHRDKFEILLHLGQTIDEAMRLSVELEEQERWKARPKGKLP